jgi:hypothetical protein
MIFIRMMLMALRVLIRYPKFTLLLAGVVLVATGANGIMDDADNPHPITKSVKEMEALLPGAGWYHVTGAQIDSEQVVGLDADDTKVANGQVPVKVITPLWAPEDPPGTKPKVFLISDNRVLIAAIGTTQVKQIDVTGMVDTSDSSHTIGKSVTIIEGLTPANFLESCVLLFLGTLGAAASVVMLIGFRRPGKATSPPKWANGELEPD